MNHLLDNPTLAVAIGAAAVLLLIAAAMFAQRATVKGAIAKGIKSRAQRAAMTYADYEKEYRKAFTALESKGYCVLDIIHDLSDEWQARDGAHQFIAYDEASALCEKIRRAKNSRLLVILHTLGGYSFPSEMIANAIKNYPDKKFACVPYVAMSGGTVIALATDKIHMGKDAFLGPIDTQYRGFPAVAFDQLRKDKHADAISDEVMLTSYMVDQHMKKAMQRAMNVLNGHHQVKGDKEFVVRELMAAGRHHAEPISAGEAKNLHINVDTHMPSDDVNALVDARLGMLRTFVDKNAPQAETATGPMKSPSSIIRRFEPFRRPDLPPENA